MVATTLAQGKQQFRLDVLIIAQRENPQFGLTW
jgi:hypothetical protein